MANTRRNKTKRSGQSKKKTKRRSSGLSEQKQEFLGLALIALAFFTGSMYYSNIGGGIIGDALLSGSEYIFGLLAYSLPVLMAMLGIILILKPWVKVRTSLLLGLSLIFFATFLGLSANTFGFIEETRSGYWQRDFMATHGGVIGESFFWAISTLLQPLGAHIIVGFSATVGIILISGKTLADLLRAVGTLYKKGIALFDRPEQSSEETSELLLPPEPNADEIVIKQRVKKGSKPVEADSNTHEELLDTAANEEINEKTEKAVKLVELNEKDLTPQGNLRQSLMEQPDFPWKLPDLKLLRQSDNKRIKPDLKNQEQVAKQLVDTLTNFGIETKIVGVVSGPHISRFELKLAPGIKVSKVAQLKDDLAYALAATEIRILAPIPGKQAVGVEVPNSERHIVHLGDVYQAPPHGSSPLSVCLGKDVAGRAVTADLAKMPHLLVAGTTGAGKSGCINAMLSSILLHASPQNVRLVLVDPKQVELNHYESIPHLLTPVITQPRKAANALQNLVREMESRYTLMSLERTRKLSELNTIRTKQGETPLPYILCVIDELADLMMVAPAEVEDAIIRLAQKARAVGIHLVLATQSPRVDVITGMIKANVPSRIAFAVSSQTDSRVILDQNGAESLLGQGDMLFAPIGSSKLQRIQGAYIDEEQVSEITGFWRAQGEPEFHQELLEEIEGEQTEESNDSLDPDEDSLLGDAAHLVVQMGSASTSMLQRRLRVGYTRAGRLIDMLERRGIISGYEGSKPRQVLVSEFDLERILGNSIEETDVAEDDQLDDQEELLLGEPTDESRY